MLRALQRLLRPITQAAPEEPAAATEHRLQLATAVLLIEVMRADSRFAQGEKPAVLEALRERFSFAEGELASLYELAEQRSIAAHDLYSFTEELNRAFDEGQRVRVLELLWSVAYADGDVDAHEAHLLRRLADLLHVGHAASIAAKLRAQRDGAARSS